MEILLRDSVKGLGKRGDVVNVADGYARNYLIPKGFAIASSAKLAAQAGAMKQAAEVRNQREVAAASAIASTLASVELVVTARTSKDGKLFGSVTATEIAERLSATASVEIDRHQIHLAEPIKTVGTYSVPIRLHPEVEVAIMVSVTSEE